jgi:SAM-dependent methyltransferase
MLSGDDSPRFRERWAPFLQEAGEGDIISSMEDLAPDPIRDIIATFRVPDRSQYPELDGYTRDELYQDCSGGGGLYLATRMVRTMRLRPGDIVLDLGCGKGAASLFLARHLGVKVIAVDLWTPATFLNQKFTARGYRDQIVPLHNVNPSSPCLWRTPVPGTVRSRDSHPGGQTASAVRHRDGLSFPARPPRS